MKGKGDGIRGLKMDEEKEKDKEPTTDSVNEKPEKKVKKHWIHPKWLRIVLKTFMWIIISLICIAIIVPILLYVPPVQTFVKNIACNIVEKSTGMKIGIDRFRLKWPVDVALDGVTIVEATGDTMVYAKEVIADVKLAPLFKLDVDINDLKLEEAGIRIMAPDSSMLLKLKANLIEIDDKSSVDIKTMTVDVNKLLIQQADLSLDMDVWKKKPAENDSVAPPVNLKILLHDAQIDGFNFGMSMLPTIDTLSLVSKNVTIRNGVIDLSQNIVTAEYLGTSDGSVTYLTPTPEYIKEHPAPVDTTSVASPPMIIKGDTVSVTDFNALYAVKGTKPLPGFDPSYLQFSKVNIRLDNFYNEASTVKLPIASISANERCGLMVTSGKGTIEVDSIGLALKDVTLQTPYTYLNATAEISFAVLEMNPYALFNIDAAGNVGWPDIEAFLPDMKPYTSKLPVRNPLDFGIVAGGSLQDIELTDLNVGITDVLNVKASGYAQNAFDIKKLRADVKFEGEVTGPKVIDNLLEIKGVHVPKLKLTGEAMAKNEIYSANFDLKTSIGSLVADGSVSLSAEKYKAYVSVEDINVKGFLPDLGIGKVDASLTAQGAGFNPTKPNADADISLAITSIDYNDQTLNNITADVILENGVYKFNIDSPNDILRLDLKGEGTLAPDLYTADVTAVIDKVDLFALGLATDNSTLSGTATVKASASPEKWLYDADLCLKDFSYISGPNYFAIPNDIDIIFKSTVDKVYADVDAKGTCINFEADTGLKEMISSFTALGDTASRQIAARDLNVEMLQHMLPKFRLNLEASGNGAIADILAGAGLSVNKIQGNITNDSIISAKFGAWEFANSSMRADTLTFSLKQRGQLLDYRAHMGNKKNNPIGDFANVNINGYVGENRLMMGLRQMNQKGETGYRLGLTAAFQDSLITVHFTPLKAMIGYIPWTFNSDNSIEVNMKTFKIDANLLAESAKSSILLKTEKNEKGDDELHLALDNVQLQDFLQLSVFAPPITAALNADLHVGYTEGWLYGTGTVGVNNFTYDRLKVGDFDLSLRAGMNDDGSTGARLGLKINGKNAIAAKALLVPDSLKIPQVKTMELDLTQFPLNIANPFLGKDVVQLSGYLNGEFDLSGSLKLPKLNGYLACDSVAVFVPMMGSSVKFNQDSILVTDNVIDFNKFDIWGQNQNPIEIDGTVDMSDLRSAVFDLKLNANNFQLINNDQKAKCDLYGKLFMDIHANARGPMEHFNLNAGVTLLKNTKVTYSIPQTTAQLTSHNTEGIVRFVNFNDTVLVMKEDTVVQPTFSMRILAGLTLENGMQVNVIYPGSTTTGTARVEIQPSGQLTYFQNYLGDMRLNGQVYVGNGFASYSMPIVGEKKFVFNPESYVQFQGDLMNPSFDIKATDDVRASVIENGNSRIVNFKVGVDITQTLQNPKLEFDLSTDDDMSIENELQSMTPNARSMAALNMLLTGQYTGAGVRTASSDLLQGTMYNILTSTINGWLANNVRGVDISLGVDQYGNSYNGETGSSTSYSYQVSKSLFNNRFKISVGGNYTTDAQADENFSENLISDISFEYLLKQTQNVTMYARLFRHTGYESILEGEITEMGGGFLLRRRLSNLKSLFKWGTPKNMQLNQRQLQGPGMGMGLHREHPNDTVHSVVGERKDSLPLKPDSAMVNKPDSIVVTNKVENNEK
ncbi:MAG: translocation/assembly module TamB domain-containing protein [Muribaculaceae bacterium]|nr:translocation/assembly module TamB domain-containing protein [Muribaculaceae bacterium]